MPGYLFKDFVGQEGASLIRSGLALLQALWRHQGGVGSLRLLRQQLDDDRLHVKEEHVHVWVCHIGLHRLHHQGVVGVLREVALVTRVVRTNVKPL